jgi:hypothetical protein
VDQLHAGLWELGFGTCRKRGFNLVSGHQYRPKAPAPRASNIGGLQAMVGGHQPDDRAMLAVCTQRDNDGWRCKPHQPRGWK